MAIQYNNSANTAAILGLKSNPMYIVSMSSLELFHSNFIAWLFDIDRNLFLNCFGVTSQNLNSLKLEREYYLGNNNKKKYITDICILENNKPLLIIENKIKSYPYKDQLDNQASFVQPECEKILLSVFDVPKQMTQGNNFRLLRYNDLVNCIRQYFPTSPNNSYSIYLSDYCKMWDDLYNVLTPYFKPFTNFEFPNSPKGLVDIGFLDVYRKYMAFVLRLKICTELNIPISDAPEVWNGVNVKTENSLYNKQAMCGFYIEFKDFSAGVQIQGNQFRILFFGDKIKKSTHCGNNRLIPQTIQDVWDYCFKNGGGIGKSNKAFNITGNNKLQCCVYGDDCIYRYEKINNGTDINIDDLIKNGFSNGLSVMSVLEYLTNNYSSIQQMKP